MYLHMPETIHDETMLQAYDDYFFELRDELQILSRFSPWSKRGQIVSRNGWVAFAP